MLPAAPSKKNPTRNFFIMNSVWTRIPILVKMRDLQLTDWGTPRCLLSM